MFDPPKLPRIKGSMHPRFEPLILGSFGGSNMTCLLLRRTAVTTWLGRWGGTARANLLTGPRDNYPGREASRAELSQWNCSSSVEPFSARVPLSGLRAVATLSK